MYLYLARKKPRKQENQQNAKTIYHKQFEKLKRFRGLSFFLSLSTSCPLLFVQLEILKKKKEIVRVLGILSFSVCFYFSGRKK